MHCVVIWKKERTDPCPDCFGHAGLVRCRGVQAVKHIQNYVDGVFVGSKQEFADVNPADGSVIAQVAEADRDLVDAAVQASRKALRGDDMAEIRAAQEELASAFQEAGRSFYAQQQSSPPPSGEPQSEPAGATSSAKPDDVVEADYEIVDEGKK